MAASLGDAGKVKMAKLTIVIEDVEDEVEVRCEGDKKIERIATPAQFLAGKLMNVTKELLELTKHVPD